MKREYQSIVEKYCPVVGHNVAVKFSGGVENGRCLSASDCERNGGCRNRRYQSTEKQQP